MISILCCCVLILIIWLVGLKSASSFCKDKSLILKAFLPILIILHHINVFGDINLKSLDVFKEWGFMVVGIFFFISGFGLMKSYEEKQKEYLREFVSRKILSSLLSPYIIACIFFYCILLIFDKPIAFKYIVYNFLNSGDTFLPYSWFVAVISMCYLIFYVSARFVSKYLLFSMFFLTINLMLMLLFYTHAAFWIVSIPSFPLGAAFSRYETHIVNLFNTKAKLFIIILFLLGIVILISFTIRKEWLSFFNIFISICITMAAILSTFNMNCQSIVKLPIIVFLSSISYEMYLTHGIVMKLLKNDHYMINNPLIYIIMLFSGTIALSWLLRYTRQKISRKHFRLVA